MTTLQLNPIPTADGEGTAEVVPAAPAAPAAPGTVDAVVAAAIDAGSDVSKLTALYLKLRDAKKDLTEQAKAKVAPIQKGLDLLENHFLGLMLEMKVDSLKNDKGTPYKSERVSITVADNSEFVDYVLGRALESLPVTPEARTAIKTAIIESGQLALIEARASKTAVEALVEETQQLPPGLARNVEAVVNVRAS